MSLRDKILNQKIKLTKIECSIDDLYVREFTVSTRKLFMEAEDAFDQQIMSIICLICDGDGKPVFTVEDIDELKEAPSTVIDELSNAVMQVITSDDELETKN